jgi:hypothetical protein
MEAGGSMEPEQLQQLVRMFSGGGGAPDNAAGSEPFALGYSITPINLTTRQPLAKAQILSGEAAMAAHALLMKIHSKKLVSVWQRSDQRAHRDSSRSHMHAWQHQLTLCHICLLLPHVCRTARCPCSPLSR